IDGTRFPFRLERCLRRQSSSGNSGSRLRSAIALRRARLVFMRVQTRSVTSPPYPVDEANTLYADGDGIDAIRVATGFSYPFYVGAPPGDTGWLFMAEQHGLIKIINLP